MNIMIRYALVIIVAMASRYLVLADLTISDFIGADLQISFNTTPEKLLLARNAMPITMSLSIPLGLLLVSHWGLARSFLLGLGFLGLSLLIAASASEASVFIFGRGIQGVASAIVSAQVYSLIRAYAPDKIFSTGVALVTGVGAVGLATGPLLAIQGNSGSASHWREVFGTLAAAVLALIPMAWLALQKPCLEIRSRVNQAQAIAASVGCGTLGIILLPWPKEHWLASSWGRILAFSTIGMILAWLWQQNRRQTSLWRGREFLVAVLVRLSTFGVVAAPQFWLVLFLRNQLEWSTEQTACLSLAFGCALGLGTMLSARLESVLRLRPLVCSCMLLGGCSLMGWIFALDSRATGLMLACNALLGLANGISIPSITSAAIKLARADQVSGASAVLILSDSLGPMLGFALESGLLLTLISSRWLEKGLSSGLPGDTLLAMTGRVQQALPVAIGGVIAMNAYMQSLQAIFFISALGLFLTAALSHRLLGAKHSAPNSLRT